MIIKSHYVNNDAAALTLTSFIEATLYHILSFRADLYPLFMVKGALCVFFFFFFLFFFFVNFFFFFFFAKSILLKISASYVKSCLFSMYRKDLECY